MGCNMVANQIVLRATVGGVTAFQTGEVLLFLENQKIPQGAGELARSEMVGITRISSFRRYFHEGVFLKAQK